MIQPYFSFMSYLLIIACSEGTYKNGKGRNCTGVKIQSPSFYTAVSRKVVGKSARDRPERYCG